MNTKPGDVYYLATGAAGEKRLALLEEVYGPDAARIMLSVGIPRGAQVADLGCGTGNTLRWFAEQVGPDGAVTGVDFSARAGRHRAGPRRRSRPSQHSRCRSEHL